MASNKVWRFLLLFGIVLVVLLSATRLGHRVAIGVTAPFSACTHQIAIFFGKLWDNVFPEDSRKELQKCRFQLSELVVQDSESRQLREENRQLRKLLKLQERKDWRVLHASVTMREPATWNWGCQIDVGSADGIVEGAPVLLGSAFIGRVAEVYGRYSQIKTLANPSCAVSVYVESAQGRYPGVLRGNASPNATHFSALVDFLPKDAVINAGDRVVSSGLGLEIPGGLEVGVIAKNSHLVDDARRAAPVTLAGDLNSLDFVSVLINK